LTKGLSGIVSQFKIITKDEFDNEIREQATVQFKVEVTGPTTYFAETENNLDGTVTAYYVPTVAGLFETKITASQVDIKNSPAETVIDPCKLLPPLVFPF